MKLWVLEYSLGYLKIWLRNNDAETARDIRYALRFESREAALEHRNARPRLWMYEPKEYEFREDRNNQLTLGGR